ncbi:unnamed protein product [Dicrocoelium dendriticum]|nr:unnamed protein product [Dicrocoelium dendriticum]
MAVLQHLTQCEDVVDAAPTSTKSGLLFPNLAFTSASQSVENDRGKQFRGNRNQTDPSMIAAFQSRASLENWDNDGAVPVCRDCLLLPKS